MKALLQRHPMSASRHTHTHTHRPVTSRVTRKWSCSSKKEKESGTIPLSDPRTFIGWNHRCVRRCARCVAVRRYVISCRGWTEFWQRSSRRRVNFRAEPIRICACQRVPGPNHLPPGRHPSRQSHLEMLHVLVSEVIDHVYCKTMLLCICDYKPLGGCHLVVWRDLTNWFKHKWTL